MPYHNFIGQLWAPMTAYVKMKMIQFFEWCPYLDYDSFLSEFTIFLIQLGKEFKKKLKEKSG